MTRFPWMKRRGARLPTGARPAAPLFALLMLGALGALSVLSGCRSTDPDDGSYLRFRNPELTRGLDSLFILGINTVKGDTLPIRAWRKDEDFPPEAPYPPGLEGAFTMLVQGYKGDVLVYQSRTAVSGGRAQPSVRDFQLVAPALTDVPVIFGKRVKDVVKLEPAWEARPGISRQADTGAAAVFIPEAVFTWTRDGVVLGRDSVFSFSALALSDSGTYVFTAENDAGRDSMAFTLTVKHMLPRIAGINAQAALAGRALTVKPSVIRSDSILYRWSKEGNLSGLSGRDSVLAFDSLRAADTGTYQLAVANASDTNETAVSNRFTVRFAPDPDAAWKAEKAIAAGAQSNSSHGTSVDLDAAKAMLFSEAEQKQGLIDFLFVYSGGAHKLMSPVAAKAAGDLTYADNFDDAKIVDVKFVKVGTGVKPATPAEGRTAYDAGAKVSSAVVAAGQGYLVKTKEANLVWVKIESIQGGTGAAAMVNLTVALGVY
jgi:hypothetical protein